MNKINNYLKNSLSTYRVTNPGFELANNKNYLSLWFVESILKHSLLYYVPSGFLTLSFANVFSLFILHMLFPVYM